MKHIEGFLRLIDDDTEDYLDDPYYELNDGTRVHIEHVFVADWADFESQHTAVESAALDGGGEVISIECGDDNYHFCNSKRVEQCHA